MEEEGRRAEEGRGGEGRGGEDVRSRSEGDVPALLTTPTSKLRVVPSP